MIHSSVEEMKRLLKNEQLLELELSGKHKKLFTQNVVPMVYN